MARAKASEGALTVKKPESVSDGEGGWLEVGAKFDAVDEEAAAQHKAKGFAD